MEQLSEKEIKWAFETWRKKLNDGLPNSVDPEEAKLKLGIVRDVKISDDKIEIIITPTYSGCPAMDMININIRME